MIRTLTPADSARLAPLLAGMDPWLTLGYSAPALQAYLDREDASLTRMVAEQDGGVVGIIALRTPWLRGPYIELLATVPALQGAGIGRALVEWAASKASSNLWACVSAFNAPARRFYAKSGFTEVAPLPGLVAEGHDEILLRKRV